MKSDLVGHKATDPWAMEKRTEAGKTTKSTKKQDRGQETWNAFQIYKKGILAKEFSSSER